MILCDFCHEVATATWLRYKMVLGLCEDHQLIALLGMQYAWATPRHGGETLHAMADSAPERRYE